MVGYRWLDRHVFEQTLEDGDEQGSLVRYSPRGWKVRHDWATELTEPLVRGSDSTRICSKHFAHSNNSILENKMNQMATAATTTPVKSVHFSSVAQSCLTLWDPMDCSAPGFLIFHQFPEVTQTHVHGDGWVGDVIQPSHPLSSPPPPTFNLFQHQGLFQWVSSSH